MKGHGPYADRYGFFLKENGPDVNENGLTLKEYEPAIEKYERSDNSTATTVVLRRHKRFLGGLATLARVGRGFATVGKITWAGTKFTVRIAGAGGLIDDNFFDAGARKTSFC